MKLSTFASNEPGILRIVAALTSTALMFLVALDANKYIDWNFILNFTLSKINLNYLILSTFLILALLFWILSILNEYFYDAITFLFFLSLLIAGRTYVSNPITSNATDGNLIKSLNMVFLFLIFLESTARLQQSKKRFESSKKVTDKATAIKTDSILNFYFSKLENVETLIISKIYYGSHYLRIFKAWLAPSFILLIFIGILTIILTAPDYIKHIFNLSSAIQDRLNFYLATFVILLLLIGIILLNTLIKKVYSSIAVGELEKRVEMSKLYDKFVRIEKKKTIGFELDWSGKKNIVLNKAIYITIIGLATALIGSGMNVGELYDATLQFLSPSPDYQEYTFLNEINERIIDIEWNIYDINEIIADLNEFIWS